MSELDFLHILVNVGHRDPGKHDLILRQLMKLRIKIVALDQEIVVHKVQLLEVSQVKLRRNYQQKEFFDHMAHSSGKRKVGAEVFVDVAR